MLRLWPRPLNNDNNPWPSLLVAVALNHYFTERLLLGAILGNLRLLSISKNESGNYLIFWEINFTNYAPSSYFLFEPFYSSYHNFSFCESGRTRISFVTSTQDDYSWVSRLHKSSPPANLTWTNIHHRQCFRRIYFISIDRQTRTDNRSHMKGVHHHCAISKSWKRRSKPQPDAYKATALPLELFQLILFLKNRLSNYCKIKKPHFSARLFWNFYLLQSSTHKIKSLNTAIFNRRCIILHPSST